MSGHRVALVELSGNGIGDGCRCVGVFRWKEVTSASACTFSCASKGNDCIGVFSNVMFDARRNRDV
eukprot:15358472-Ditylum_brightwellii.AAC.1